MIPRGVATAANSRQTLLSSQTAIAGGAGLPTKNPDGKPGWFYENLAGEKINWYLYGDTNYTNNTMNSFGGMYAIVDIESGYLYFVYTKPTGSGDASWYKSRIQWDDDNAQTVQALLPGRYVLHTPGMDLAGVDKTLPRIEIPQSVAISDGAGAGTEEVWLMAISSSSNFPAGYNKFTVEQFAYKFDEHTHVQDLVALPELSTVGEPAAASDPGTKFWMSSVANGGALLASGGGYFLYAGPAGADASDVELTMDEAAAAANARVFTDYTGKTLAERADMTEPIVLADEAVLADVTRKVKGYFHSQDLTLTQIVDKMNLYGPALQAAAAGSVELTLAQVQAMTIPVASSSGSFPYNPNSIFVMGDTGQSSENYYLGDPAYDAYGIDRIEFNQSFITIHFKDSASMNAWRSQDQIFEVVVPGATWSFEKPLTMNDAAMYGSPSYYNYIHYTLPGQLTTQEKKDLSLVSASSAQPFTIEINNSGQAPADALGETDVVAEIIGDLQLHLAKFPR